MYMIMIGTVFTCMLPTKCANACLYNRYVHYNYTLCSLLTTYFTVNRVTEKPSIGGILPTTASW